MICDRDGCYNQKKKGNMYCSASCARKAVNSYPTVIKNSDAFRKQDQENREGKTFFHSCTPL
jgi:hypothetical protein